MTDILISVSVGKIRFRDSISLRVHTTYAGFFIINGIKQFMAKGIFAYHEVPMMSTVSFNSGHVKPLHVSTNCITFEKNDDVELTK